MIKTRQPESTTKRVLVETPDCTLTAKNETAFLQTPSNSQERNLRRIERGERIPVKIRIPTESDAVEIQTFYERISTESKNDRVTSKAEINSAFATSMSEAFEPGQEIVMVATRQVGDKTEVVGLGCYTRNRMNVAELSLSIDGEFKGLGIENQLLESLSLLAEKMGIECLTATVHATNTLVLTAFRQSGFKMTAKANHGCIIVSVFL